MKLSFRDWREDRDGWAQSLGVTRDAIDLYLDCDVIDLHVDTFIWHRLFGYDLHERHRHGLFGARCYSQVDLPRIREAQVTGATWVITTNPFRPQSLRPEAFSKNLDRLVSELSRASEDVAVVRNVAEYKAARAKGLHAAFIGVQGGNALDESIDALDRLKDNLVLRITLVHLSSSKLGVTSSPAASLAGDDEGLAEFGFEYIHQLNHRKVFVDLAHISRKGFWDALSVHDKTLPVIVTHTGVCGVHEHWRNLDDKQVRAIGERGGVVGVMYQSSFLGDSMWGGRAESVVRHLEHVANIAGDSVAALGSDWDGAITPPRDMPTCLELPRLVQIMLDRQWSHTRIRRTLGANFLDTVSSMRG